MRKWLFVVFLLLSWNAHADERCPLADIPAPRVVPADFSGLVSALKNLQDVGGRPLVDMTPEGESELRNVFQGSAPISKLEQFYQLLYWIQRHVPESRLPVTIKPPGITEVLLAAKVFKNPDFPKKIMATTLTKDDKLKAPKIQVAFANPEVRFPLNEGIGFASWDQGKCQVARELVFYNPFSFRLRTARNSKNLVVDDFTGVNLYGDFGSVIVVHIDLKYIDLEKVEFIRGTEEGKVTARVAKREFVENEHSSLFKFVGTLIPNTSRQRIDW